MYLYNIIAPLYKGIQVSFFFKPKHKWYTLGDSITVHCHWSVCLCMSLRKGRGLIGEEMVRDQEVYYQRLCLYIGLSQ